MEPPEESQPNTKQPIDLDPASLPAETTPPEPQMPASNQDPRLIVPVANMGALAISNADKDLLEPGEVLVTVVRRHPIGIIGIYLEMFTGIAGVATLAILAIFVFFTQQSTGAKGLIAAGALFVIAFLIGLLAIASYVYRQSRLVVTDRSLVQVIQHALFNRKISRLSMSNVEDVNAEQKGILPTMFNYGTVTIQTAGQEDNFVFPFCPDPDRFADRVLEARQRYVQHYGEHPKPPV